MPETARKFHIPNPLHHEDRHSQEDKERPLPKKILVPYDDSPASKSALDWAFKLGHLIHGSEIEIVYIVPVPRNLRLDVELPDAAIKGEEILDIAEKKGKDRNISAKGELLQARGTSSGIAMAIVDEATEKQIDLIVIGINGKDEFGNRKIGQIAEIVLHNANCEVFIVHSPSEKASAETNLPLSPRQAIQPSV